MWIKVKRAFYGDEKGVKAGDIIEVTEARGRQLVKRNLADETDAPAAVSAEAEGGEGSGGEKQATKPDNKQAQKPENKSAA